MHSSDNKPRNNHFILVLFLAWSCMQFFLFYKNGIVTHNEAQKYITRADLLLETGTLPHPSMWLYATQIFLIAAAKITGIGYVAVVIVQLLLNALATYFLFRLFTRLGNSIIAFVLTLIFILNFPFQSFNTTLYTESIYYSLLILATYFLLQMKELTLKNLGVLLLLLLLICFTRPSGLLLVPCAFIYLFTRFFSIYHWAIKIGVVLAVCIVFALILNTAMGVGGQLDFMLPFKEEHIICGLPTITGPPGFESESNSIFGIFSYITKHPDQFFRLAWQRSLSFFGLTREYYSGGHNIYLMLYFFPFYLLALFSLPSWWKTNRAILFYCLAFILLTWITVIFTCDDWHNRFFLTTIPFFYLLSIPAVTKLLAKFSKR